MRSREFFVYVMASRSGVLYIGVTGDLERRVAEHKAKVIPGFTSQYNVNRLVYVETYPDATSAIAREKQLKTWRREKKVGLITAQNPEWRDLSEGWLTWSSG
jgi:putative endonuclease